MQVEHLDIQPNQEAKGQRSVLLQKALELRSSEPEVELFYVLW